MRTHSVAQFSTSVYLITEVVSGIAQTIRRKVLGMSFFVLYGGLHFALDPRAVDGVLGENDQ